MLASLPTTPAHAEASADARLLERAKGLFEPIPTAPPQLPGNVSTPEKVELGKMLFFEPRLSASWFISCNSCHNLATAGVDLQPASIGHGWNRGGRNAPTVLNSVFNFAQFWDGRAKDLMEQAQGPVQAAVEMNSKPADVVAFLNAVPEYGVRFSKVFPDDKEPVSFKNMARAIEVYEATLITPNARFDKFLRGDLAALTGREKTGLDLFMDKGCSACHNGINLGGNSYQPFGVMAKPGAEILPEGDPGRFQVTKTATDEYVFKVPTLRNIVLTPPYFHSGKVWDVEQAVAVMGSSQLGATLSGDEIAAIADFLDSLNGDMPKTDLPILPAIASGGPAPHLRPALPEMRPRE
ncbi:cytochrome C biogenesis protein CcsA [Skermanella stibiiresistens SB22]|uniref:Cytochrome C biogenesis protein CcsA n=1 Tax=Skermanella stibiiresistens SB22 TaxID=1385369 RepID=W9GZ12_9PROT|nr:cytochrome C biogenesis protein CcsA [Skermanella stibiiresistens SB22]